MALVFGDRVLETTTTTGTGPFALAGAVTGYQRFSAAATVSDTLYAAIFAVDTEGVPSGDWQAGLATYSDTNELTFTSVTDSSTGGSAITFGAGTKWVIACPTANYFSQLVTETSVIPIIQSLLPTSGGGGTTEFATAARWSILTLAPGSDSTNAGWGEIELYGNEWLTIPLDGTASASSTLTGWAAAEAFDGLRIPGNGWLADPGAESVIGSRLEFEFDAPITPERIGLDPVKLDEQFAPEEFAVEYWDGAAWVRVGEFATAWTTDARKYFYLVPVAGPGSDSYLPLAGGTTTGAINVPDLAYDATTWNGSLAVPTRNAVRDKIEDILDGVTFTGDISVPDEAYDATAWNGSVEVPTKNAVRDKIEALAATIPAAGASTTQTKECIAGFIASPANKDYRIVVKIPHGGTITETTTRSVSGTCTATFKVNTTALGGTANSVSSSEQAQSHASSNTFAADDDIVLTVSSNSACVDMSFSIKYTRTLD